MKLPTLEEPARYQGLYVFDFGDWCAVGYTAEEIAALLESEQYADGKVYKIHRANPDGEVELRGVANTRFQFESGMFFYRNDLDAAKEDYSALTALAEATKPACRAFVHLVDRGEAADYGRYATVLVFPAEYEDEISRWLLDANYQGGDTAEGGISHVTNFYEQEKETLERVQLWGANAIPSRSRDEIYANVRQAVQR